MRTYRRLEVRLKKADRDRLDGMLSGGVQPVRTVLRALALQHLNPGKSPAEVASLVSLTSRAVREIGCRYEPSGLDQALYDKQRPGAATLLQPAERKRVMAMVCSDPPAGRSRWTVRLVAEEAVKRRRVPKVGRETIRRLLRHDDLKPWRKKMWNVPELTEQYVERMEDVLETYERPLAPAEPVVCLDEKPVTLHAQVRPAVLAEPGREARRDSAYSHAESLGSGVRHRPRQAGAGLSRGRRHPPGDG